jgi:hypothetical protein
VQYENSGGLVKPKKKINYFLLLLLLHITDSWKCSVAYSNRLRDGFPVWETAVACSKAHGWKENDNLRHGTQGSIELTARYLLSDTTVLATKPGKRLLQANPFPNALSINRRIFIKLCQVTTRDHLTSGIILISSIKQGGWGALGLKIHGNKLK